MTTSEGAGAPLVTREELLAAARALSGRPARAEAPAAGDPAATDGAVVRLDPTGPAARRLRRARMLQERPCVARGVHVLAPRG